MAGYYPGTALERRGVPAESLACKPRWSGNETGFITTGSGGPEWFPQPAVEKLAQRAKRPVDEARWSGNDKKPRRGIVYRVPGFLAPGGLVKIPFL
jgi:hypothetical protein